MLKKVTQVYNYDQSTGTGTQANANSNVKVMRTRDITLMAKYLIKVQPLE
jgi:hypothetical protein